MSSLKDQILDQFEMVRRERDLALKRLKQAEETITLLEAEITASKYHGDLAYAKVAAERSLSKSQIGRPARVESTKPTVWIDEIWLCSSETAALLGHAEESWRNSLQNPQAAILLATQAAEKNLIKIERLRCKLFLAAVQFSAGSLELACTLATECIDECGIEPRFREIAGIGHYIRGRVFMAMDVYLSAHWDFSIAVHTEGYHDKIKKWQGLCESYGTEAEISEAIEHDDGSISDES
jgi:hypothetical protein